MSLKIQNLWEETKRRIRVEFNSEIIADTKNAMLMIDSSYEINYYFPLADVKQDYLVDVGYEEKSGYKGTSKFFNVQVGDQIAENGAWTYPNLKDNRPDMRGYIAFVWKLMDHWYEEDEEVIGHARNPYHRIDTIQSSRHIRIEVDGELIAESSRPVLLFETGLPTRYYIPQEDVIADLTHTDTHTICPYKGTADYWSFDANGKTYNDLVWGYLSTFDAANKIKGLVAFYDEKVDVILDGELQEKPRTVFA